MKNRDFNLAAAMAAMFLTGGNSDAADPTTLTVVLQITDYTGVNRHDFSRARVEARRIFASARIRVLWVDVDDGPGAWACAGRKLFVSLLSPYLASQHALQEGGREALGKAEPSTGHAFIFIERVAALASRTRIDEGILLGRIIAHEVGHLLLPEARHSLSGLMTAEVDTGPAGPKTLFAPGERLAIRAQLQSGSAPTDAAANCGTETADRPR